MKKRTDPRHIARKYALQVLFEQVFRKDDTLDNRIQKISNQFSEELNPNPKPDDSKKDKRTNSNNKKTKKRTKIDLELFTSIVKGVTDKKERIDRIVAECAPEWPLNQIARVDLSILRIATFEVLHHENTPTKVAIDEAVELAKEFGGDNSSKFVNGVLGSVVKKYGENTKPEEDEKEGTSTIDSEED